MRRRSGFTMIELLIMTAIATAILAIFIQWITYRTKLNMAKAYANQTTAYSNVFLTYLTKNKATILANMTPGSSIVVSWNDLVTQGYVPTGFSTNNMYNQKPCLIITQQPSKILYPILVYVDGRAVESFIFTRSMSWLGGVSGYYSKSQNSIIGALGAWKYNNFTSYPISNCGNTIQNGALAVNIGMMNAFNDAISPDVSLHRPKDYQSNLGESFNTNTAFTDLTLTKAGNQSSAKLFFNHANNIYLAQNNVNDPTTTISNAAITANSVQPIVKNNPGTACTSSQLGSISSQTNATSGMQSSTLVCSYNPPVCRAQSGTDYCYTPIKSNTIKYTNTGYMGSSFTCPGIAPIAIDAQNNAGTAIINYRSCPMKQIFEWDCNSGSPQSQSVSSGVSGQFLSSPINVNGQTFNINVGYQVTGTPTDLTSCSSRCSALGMDVGKIVWGKVNNYSCLCNKQKNGNFDANGYFDAYSVSSGGSATIKYITCSSKMILTQQ
ncbi:MAG: shufflon system plasmid conjugative transfer pilus tip adhesin PilV [Neisseriaceae bacterium]|nr:MAG: shufflon system plasmid conjugative transfer pilus tip adhesin PilV [Neisseriaceae bacterium]